MKKFKSIFCTKTSRKLGFMIALILAFFSTDNWCAKIIYPWRATTAIVKVGETFEVWFDADSGQTINSIILEGPYNSVTSFFSVENGNWEYDGWSGNTYDIRLTVTVPADAPADKYDLILNTSSGNEISSASVKVIKEYKSTFYLMHFSDPHRWETSKNTLGILYKDQTVVLDIANIIDPEIFIETGDSYWQTPSDPSLNQNRLHDIMHGSSQVKGMHELESAALFMIPGNHDTPTHHSYDVTMKVAASAWNDLFGLQYHNFIYSSARFVGINNSWCPSDGSAPNFQWQIDKAVDWINSVGGGNMRIAYFHIPQDGVPLIYNSFKSAEESFKLMIGGHIHRYTTNPYSIDGNPIIYTAAGLKNGTTGAPFNLYKLNLNDGTFTSVGNSYSGHASLQVEKDWSTSKLILSYSKENNGSNANNTATIVNKFNFPIEGARVRFVLPKGIVYSVLNSSINQEFDGDIFHIIDIKVDLDANSTTTITVKAIDYCPDDPNKTEPGNCGCGEVEGTCDKYSLVVNSGSGTGDYYPFEEVSVSADSAQTNMKFDKWVIDSGTPSIVDIHASSTTMHLGGNAATITATFKEYNTIYQAEDAVYNGATLEQNFAGYHGSGYIAYKNPYNDFIEWRVDVPSSGSYNLIFRYANQGWRRPLELMVNGSVAEASLDFPATGAWTNWDVVLFTQSLNAGENLIRLTAIGLSGSNIDELRVGEGITSINESTDIMSKRFVLHQNYPNPFNPTTKIKYSIPIGSFVSLKVYDLLGRDIMTLVNGRKQKGTYQVEFDGKNLASGMYFYSLRAADFIETKKFVLLK